MPLVAQGASSAVRVQQRHVRMLAFVGAFLLSIVGLVVAPAAPADARYATGGTGRYIDSIDWFEWGAAGQKIADGSTMTQTNTTELGDGVTIATTCTISNVVSQSPQDPLTPSGKGLETYRSGSWYGDALDNMYNIGGTGTNNQLVSGLVTGVGPRDPNRNPFTWQTNTVQFRFSCSSTVTADGVTKPLPLQGLVFADAESSNVKQRPETPNEWIDAWPTSPTGTKWHIIDRARSAGCTTSTLAFLQAGNRLTMEPNASQCASLGSSHYGPAAVTFLEGSTSANVLLQGQGRTAVALGVMLSLDYGDAPSSYGTAASVLQPSWQTGTSIPSVRPGAQVSPDSFVLSTQGLPKTRLGSTVDAERANQPSGDARADDNTRTDDEDAWSVNQIDVKYVDQTTTHQPSAAYQTYSAQVRCTNQSGSGKGNVAGWVDWNGNGTFDDGERSDVKPCPYSSTGTVQSVTLTWTVPADAVSQPTSFIRLRMADDVAELTPTGLSVTGEVEDHPLKIVVPDRNLVVDKYWVIDGGDPVADGQQPEGITAELQLSGPDGAAPSAQDWGTHREGYEINEPVNISETVTISPEMVGCQVVSQEVTKVNGTDQSGTEIGDDAAPYEHQIEGWDVAADGSQSVRKTNTVEVTNTVECESRLELVKSIDPDGDGEVLGNASPTDWTLTGSSTEAPADLQEVTGEMPDASTPVSGVVAQDTAYVLSESDAHPEYVQQGEWQCVTATGRDSNGALTFGDPVAAESATTQVGRGGVVRCTVTNETAKLTVLKEVPDDLDPTAPFDESDFTLDIDPGANELGLTPQNGVPGSNVASETNSFSVRPGHTYQVSEKSVDPDLAYVNTQVQYLDENGDWHDIDPSEITLEAGQHLTIRFVNVPPGSVPLPLTGGFAGMFPVVGGGAVLAALAAAAWYVTRRKQHAEATLLDD